MKKISSTYYTTHFKEFLPMCLVGIGVLILLISLLAGVARDYLAFVIFPCLMIAAGCLSYKGSHQEIVDEVYDSGDHLIIRNNDIQDVVYLSNVTDIFSSTDVRRPLITLKLNVSCNFGNEISFCPISKARFYGFDWNEIFTDLSSRIEQARKLKSA